MKVKTDRQSTVSRAQLYDVVKDERKEVCFNCQTFFSLLALLMRVRLFNRKSAHRALPRG